MNSCKNISREDREREGDRAREIEEDIWTSLMSK
jgi:hypothetical protein